MMKKASQRNRKAARRPTPSAKAAPKGARNAPSQYTEAERAAALVLSERRKGRQRLPKTKADKTETGYGLSWAGDDQTSGNIAFANVTASDDLRFANGVMEQLGRIASRQDGTLRSSDVDFCLSVVRAIEPRDPVEALLASQMAAIHNATMQMAQYMACSQTRPQLETGCNMLNKLARTFALQTEALKKHRSSGEQTIKVQHVTVNEGGQAIVGNVNRGGGGCDENSNQPDEVGPAASASSADAPGPAMLGKVEAFRPAMQSASGEGLARVPRSRRAGRSTQG